MNQTTTAIHPLFASHDYKAAAARLRDRLASFGITVPPEKETAFFEGVLYSFDDACFAYAETIQHPLRDPWYAVEVGPAGAPFLPAAETINTAVSLADALAWAIGEMDDNRVFADAVSVAGEQIEFRRGGELIVRIAPVVFEPSDRTARERVDTALKGSLRIRDGARAIARLQSIPGLEHLTGSNAGVGSARGSVLNHTAADLAGRVRRMLADEVGIDVKQHQALELAAALFNAPSWQHLVAHEGEEHCFLDPVVVEIAAASKPAVWRFYRTSSEAVWAFARAVKEANAVGAALTPKFFGSSIIHTALCLHTDDNLNTEDPALRIGCWPPSQVDGSALHFGTVQNMLLGSGDLQQRLEAMLDIGSEPDRRVATANLRMGVLPNQVLTLRGLTFTIRSSAHGPLESMLSIERLDGAGRQVERAAVKIYKASIRPHFETGTWVILGDYERDLVYSLTDFTAEDAARLAAFAEMQLSDVPWSAVEHAEPF